MTSTQATSLFSGLRLLTHCVAFTLVAVCFADAVPAQSLKANSADGQAIWIETEHPVVRTLAELRRLQDEVGQIAFEVDLQAQLSFASRYWDVFFIQDGDLPSMVRCSDAASTLLCTQPFGKWLRIRGLVYANRPEIALVSFELLPESQPVQSLRLNGVPKPSNLPRDRVVEMPCRLLEVLDKVNQSFLFAELNKDIVELQVEDLLSPQQYLAVEVQAEALVKGTMSPKFDWTRFAQCAIRMMGQEQLTIGTNSVATRRLSPKTQIEGPVLFTDSHQQIVVGDSTGAWRVETRFAEHLKPGQIVTVRGHPYSSDKGQTTTNQHLQASHMSMVREVQLAASVDLSVGSWEQAKQLPSRVSLEAVVVGQSVNDGIRTYHMRSANKHFTTYVNEESESRELFRVGDRIRVIGTPLVDTSVDKQAIERLKLYVTKPGDTQFVSAPFLLSLSHLVWATSIGTLLVGIAFSWNWLLHRQVSERTQGLKKLSSHLRMSFDAISEAVLITDADRRLSIWNRQFEQLFGESPVEHQPIDVPLGILRKRLTDPTVFAPLLRAGEAHSGEPVSATLTLDNPTQVVRAFVSSIVDIDGTYHGHLYTFEDVTEKERLEAELFQSQKMEAIGQLSGGVAHDFNNLLTIISSNLALIKFLDSPAALEYVNAAETAVKRAAELTQQLLDFSRRSRLEIQVVDLNDLIGRIGMLLRRTFDRSISLQIEQCSAPLYACVDVNRLEQVLINICINARDAIKGRVGRITLRVAPAVEDISSHECFARIEIEDNGCGMSREVKSRIFDPFFTTKKIGEGTGLGLSMAQGVIEQLGGRISCRSQPDVGTCFCIDLPLTEPSESDFDKPFSPIAGCHRSLRILLVDDEMMVRNAGQALLKGLGHLPTVAAGGQQAIALLEKEAFDVVLLDLTMPTMSGKEAYVEIHKRWPELPVAICTGYYLDLNTWNNDCAIGPPKIITKPYSVESLSNYLQSLA